MQRKLRIGLIGAGRIARGEHVPAWLQIPSAEIVAVADASQEAIHELQKRMTLPTVYDDWRKLLEAEDLDAVDICTPNQLHTVVARAALDRRLHVLCEKPLATTSREVLQLQQSAIDSGRILMTAQHLRFRPASQQLKALIKQGMLGSIYYARCQWLRRRLVPTPPTFIEKRLSGGGPGIDIGVHVLDLAYWFMETPKPVAVTAMAGAFLAHRSDLGGGWGNWDRALYDVEDFTAGFVRFADGQTLTLEASWLAFQPDPETIRVQCYGTQGGLLWPEGTLTGERDQVPWTMTLEPGDDKIAYLSEIRAFADAILQGKPSPVPVEETLDGIRILEALYESARLGREVRMDR
jgi:predicted dehydrogenase